MAFAKLTRRRILLSLAAVLAVLVIVLARPVVHLTRALLRDVDQIEPLPAGFVDDASRLNTTKVAEFWPVPRDTRTAERQLAELLRRARLEALEVSIAGAQHSMGGHTISPGGIVIDMRPFNRMDLDDRADMLHVQAGALWSEIIPYLDQRGRSVTVMQSNNSFTVGGSISVNCHGWVYDRPPIAASVESLRLMKADGTIVRCSRQENAELFSLVLGGYGLFGVILDIDLHIGPNERYRLEQFIVPVDQSLTTFQETVEQKSGVRMVYARLGIAPNRLFQDVILNVLYLDPDGDTPKLTDPGALKLRRAIFRGSAESEYGKELRWAAETKLQPYLTHKIFSRNQLLNEGVETFQNRSADSTDILHEYFVPPGRVSGFVEDMRQIIPEHQGNLLNVTVRSVNTDDDSFLRYADQPMFCFVMLFNQRRTEAAESQMEAMTQELIESALRHGGRYYLPYRLHATVAQFHRAYPQGRQFFELKRKYDPDELFQNQFYAKYVDRAKRPQRRYTSLDERD